MSSNFHTEFTLQELAQIALGTEEDTPENNDVLYTLLDVLLRKIGCENEIVKLPDAEGRYIKSVLQTSEPPLFQCNDKKITTLLDKVERITVIDYHIKEADRKLECHMESIRKHSGNRSMIPKYWICYEHSCETACHDSDDELESAPTPLYCKLASNSDFVNKIRGYISVPFVKYIKDLEHQLENVYQTFLAFKKSADALSQKVKLIQYCCFEYAEQKLESTRVNHEFQRAVCEIQEMLNCKLDRVEFSAFKKYIDDEMDKLADVLLAIKEPDPNNKWQKNSCISCGAMKVKPSEETIEPDLKKEECKSLATVSQFRNDLLERMRTINANDVSRSIFTDKEAEKRFSIEPRFKSLRPVVMKIQYQSRKEIGGGSGYFGKRGGSGGGSGYFGKKTVSGGSSGGGSGYFGKRTVSKGGSGGGSGYFGKRTVSGGGSGGGSGYFGKKSTN